MKHVACYTLDLFVIVFLFIHYFHLWVIEFYTYWRTSCEYVNNISCELEKLENICLVTYFPYCLCYFNY